MHATFKTKSCYFLINGTKPRLFCGHNNKSDTLIYIAVTYFLFQNFDQVLRPDELLNDKFALTINISSRK